MITVYHGGYKNRKLEQDGIQRTSGMVFTAQLLKNRQDVIEALQMVYNSFISEKIDDYNSSVYYENPSYLYECFVENKML